MIIYHNGQWIKDEAIFTFNDRIRLGDGVFDTMLVVDGAPLHYNLHAERLINDAKTFGVIVNTLPDPNEIIKKNNAQKGRYAINTIITRGVGERGLTPSETPTPTIAMRIATVPDEFPPIHAIISETVRRNEGSPLSRIKSCNYGDNILALLEAKEKGANEAILLNNKGFITCASAGNIFAEINGKLFTPPLSDGCMDGVTRKIIIERFDAQEKSLTADNLKNTNGIYITNSIKGIKSVTSLNGKILSKPAIQFDKDCHLQAFNTKKRS